VKTVLHPERMRPLTDYTKIHNQLVALQEQVEAIEILAQGQVVPDSSAMEDPAKFPASYSPAISRIQNMRARMNHARIALCDDVRCREKLCEHVVLY